MNSITLTGNLTSDPEAPRQVGDATVVNFRIAHNQQGEGKPTLFFSVESWNGFGVRIASDAKKGDPVLVTGRLKLEDWKDKDGNDREDLFIRAHEVRILQKFEKLESDAQ